MGVGSSKDMQYGVAHNPRVDFALKQSKKANRMVLLDAPPLLQLPNATLRYRYKNNGINQVNQLPREKPHEGTNLAEKHNYFIHHKYNGATDDPERTGNYFYVYKGPERARQKHIYYVFGKGMKVKENGFLESNYKPEEQSFNRPIFYKTHGHIYMDLIILKKDVNSSEEAADPLEGTSQQTDLENNSDDDILSLKDTELTLPITTQLLDIKIEMGRKYSTIAPHIHLYLHGAELKSDQKLKDIIKITKGTKELNILLHPK